MSFQGFVLAVLVAVLLAGCTAPFARPGESLRLGGTFYVGDGLFFVAKEKGFFDQEGINVEITEGDPTALKQAVLAGQIDVAYFTADAVAFDAAQGAPVKLFWSPSVSEGADGIVAPLTIRTIEDLKGKKIAVQKGVWSHFLLASILHDHNVAWNEIQIIDLDGSKAVDALYAGDADAAVTWEPVLTQSTASGTYHILATSRDYPELVIDVFMARETTLQQKSKAITQLLRAIEKSRAFMTEHPREAAAIAAPAFQLSPDEYQNILQNIRFHSAQDNAELFAPNGRLEFVLAQSNRVWVESGLVTNPKPVSEIFTSEFVNAFSQAQ